MDAKQERPELRIRGLSTVMHDKITAIAKDYYGVTVTEYVKTVLVKAINEHPQIAAKRNSE